MLSGYEDKTEFVECEFRVSVCCGQRKVPVTSDMGKVVERLYATGYQLTHITYGRTRGKETKAYPTIRKPIDCANWGYPKRKRRKAIADLGLKIPQGYGALIVVRDG
jgi:hypothetical protein